MKAAVARAPSASLAQRFKQRILHGYFVRIHMGLILTAVTASGLLASKGMLMAGVLSLRFRYPVAILCSYLVFLGLVRIWIWYVCRGQAAGGGGLDFGNIDLTGSRGFGWWRRRSFSFWRWRFGWRRRQQPLGGRCECERSASGFRSGSFRRVRMVAAKSRSRLGR